MNAVITQDLGISTKTPDTTNKSIGRLGELLAQARKAKDLDIKFVAQKLHLSANIIQSLEQNQFDKIRAVFIRGYIKKYAKLLELNETDLPSLPIQENVALPLPRPSAYSAELQHEIHSNHIVVQTATWLIVLGIISLFGLWWQGQLEWESTELTPTPQISSQPSESMDHNNSLKPSTPLSATLSSVSTNSNSSPSISGTPLTTNPIPVSTTPISPPLTPPIQPVPTTPIQPQPSTSPTLPAPTAVQAGQAVAGGIEVPASTVPATSPTLPVETPPPREIVLKILKTSKVEVTDATEKFKLNGKLRKGEEYKFAGQPPYNIVLERASSVKLTIDGKPFKIKSRSRNGNVSFTLDSSNLEN